MKNSKRMMAVIAASGLALGSMPGVANAQGSAELGLNLGAALGSAELGLELGAALGSTAPGDLPTIPGDLPTGSDGLSSGSTDADGNLDLGSLTEGSTGDNAPDFGSITEGSTDADGNLDLGSLGSITDPFDSLSAGSTDADGNLDLGSLTGGTGSDFGSGDINVPGSGTGSDAGTILALGSLAGAGIGIGLIVSGGVNLPGSTLPPLPEINLGIVCNLPPEAIDFLKDNGSMEQDECEPEEEQN